MHRGPAFEAGRWDRRHEALECPPGQPCHTHAGQQRSAPPRLASERSVADSEDSRPPTHLAQELLRELRRVVRTRGYVGLHRREAPEAAHAQSIGCVGSGQG